MEKTFTGYLTTWPDEAVNLDVPAIAGVSIFVAVVYVSVNFAVDVLYGVIDPRIRIT